MKKKSRPSRKRTNEWLRLFWKKSESQALLSRPNKNDCRENKNFKLKRTNSKKNVLSGWLKMRQTERRESLKKNPSANVASKNTKVISKSNFRWSKTFAYARMKKKLHSKNASKLRRLQSNKQY